MSIHDAHDAHDANREPTPPPVPAPIEVSSDADRAERTDTNDVPHDVEDHGSDYPPEHPAHHPRYAGRWIGALLGLTVLGFAGIGVHDAAQNRDRVWRDAHTLTGGDPHKGPALMRQYGCAGCHTVPGVPGATGTVGPPLSGIAVRSYLGGVVTNTPDNLVLWIVDPKQFDAKTAMPKVGLREEQARHIAAYLYTLQ